jgi:uncharacterized protein with HEPN domain
MTAGASRLPDYLRHLQQAIGRIERYTVGMDEGAFRADTLVQDAVIRNFEVIGEACRNILRDAPDFAARHPELPLSGAYEMRNALAHGYFKIDLGVVWTTIKNDLPILRSAMKAVSDPS